MHIYYLTFRNILHNSNERAAGKLKCWTVLEKSNQKLIKITFHKKLKLGVDSLTTKSAQSFRHQLLF